MERKSIWKEQIIDLLCERNPLSEYSVIQFSGNIEIKTENNAKEVRREKGERERERERWEEKIVRCRKHSYGRLFVVC